MTLRAAPIYEIRVRGHLDPAWADWLERANIENRADGEAVLTVPIADQAALHGLLNRVFALNLCVLAVNQRPPAPRREQPLGAGASVDAPQSASDQPH